MSERSPNLPIEHPTAGQMQLLTIAGALASTIDDHTRRVRYEANLAKLRRGEPMEHVAYGYVREAGYSDHEKGTQFYLSLFDQAHHTALGGVGRISLQARDWTDHTTADFASLTLGFTFQDDGVIKVDVDAEDARNPVGESRFVNMARFFRADEKLVQALRSFSATNTNHEGLGEVSKVLAAYDGQEGDGRVRP